MREIAVQTDICRDSSVIRKIGFVDRAVWDCRLLPVDWCSRMSVGLGIAAMTNCHRSTWGCIAQLDFTSQIPGERLDDPGA